MCENAKIDISSAGFYIFAMAFMIIGGYFHTYGSGRCMLRILLGGYYCERSSAETWN